MSYEQIWAPWRLSYVAAPKSEPAGGCFLCRYRDDTDDAANLVLWRGSEVLTVLNRFPYNNGHLLIAPREHKAELEQLTDAEALECQRQLQQMTALLKRVLRAEGFNIGLNLGHVAGAGLPGHLHWHLVPRWSGDTNFMPVVGNVKVIPQSLQALYEVLQAELALPPSS